MLNKVILIGRLTKQPDIKTTSSGVSVSTFNLAVEKNYVDKNTGERGANFIRCVIWRKSAENFVNFVSKGSLVGIEGELTSRSYDNQNGQREYITEVIVDNFFLLESKATSDARKNGQLGGQQNGYNNQQTGYGGQQNGYNNQQSGYGGQQNGYNNQQSGYGGQQGGYNNQGQNSAFNNQQNRSNNTNTYGGNQPAEDPFSNNYPDTIDISDDDLPF